MNWRFNFKVSLYALMLLGGLTACTSETEFLNNEGKEELTPQSGIRFVIQTPSPDALVTRATQAGDTEENKVNKISLYIFALDSDVEDTDANYKLLVKKENIAFVSSGEPGVSGTDSGDGTLSYTEPITADMIGRRVKMLLVANDQVAGATESSTTLEAFKLSAATAVANDTGDGVSSDAVSGNIYAKSGSPAATGLVMSAVAYTGDTEGQNESVVLTPLGVDMKASFQRIVARIDLVHAVPNMTLKGVKLLNASSKGYLFKQNSTDAPAGDKVTLLPTSGYTDRLASGITFDAVTTDNNTLKHVFYLYEQSNTSNDDCVKVELSYRLKMGNKDKDGTLTIAFRKEEGAYVNTTRNTLYTIQMGDGKEATDINKVTTVTVADWNTEEPEIEDSFTPGEDTHSEVIAPADAQIGDYYLSDGTLRRPDYQFTAAEKAKVIGVVFQTDPARIGQAEKDALRDAGVDTPHGLVMAVKLAGKPCAWGPEETDETALSNIATVKTAYEDISGLENYNKLKEMDAEFSNHPAFQTVKNFSEKVPAPTGTTGWFLPSSGQWLDIVANLGQLPITSEQKNDDTHNYWKWYYAESGDDTANGSYISKTESFAQNNINLYLNYVDKITDTWYWSSSEYSETYARYAGFNRLYFIVNYGSKTETRNVMAVLAF